MKKISCIGLVSSILLIIGCQKTDTEKIPIESNELKDDSGSAEEAAMRSAAGRGCELIEASSKALSNSREEERALFTKEMENGKLKRVMLDFIDPYFLNIDSPRIMYGPQHFNVTHPVNQMVFTRVATGDTGAVFTFDQHRRLVKAWVWMPFAYDCCFRSNFQFFYRKGKLDSIAYQENGPDWYPYVKVHYDKRNQNVSQVLFSYYGFNPVITNYTYDYKRKANGQFYGDESYLDYAYFWHSLRYLELFPEIMPQHLLVKTTFDAHGPQNPPYGRGLYVRNYSDHQFDGFGRVISYVLNPTWGGVQQPTELWNLKWDCN